MTDLPYVLSLFLTFPRKKSQLDAVPAHFFNFFFETVGAAAALHCKGPGHDIADVVVIWGRNFSNQKSTFFNFDFDKKWFGGGLGPF